MKRAILFDFWQTLFDDSKEWQTFAARKGMMQTLLDERGYPSPADLDPGFAAARSWFLEVYHREQRTPSLEERLVKVLNHFAIELRSDDLAELVDGFGELGLLLDPTPTPHVVETLLELSKLYLLGLVSDTGYTPGSVLRKHLARHGILDSFSALSFSNETGHAKPHRQAFLIPLQQLDVMPSQAIHCGDLPDHDILGAKQLGLTAVLYTGCHVKAVNGIPPDFVISDWRELPDIAAKVFA